MFWFAGISALTLTRKRTTAAQNRLLFFYGGICGKITREAVSMHFQTFNPQDATGLISLIGLIAIFIGLLFLVRRTQRKRQQRGLVNPSATAKPFPQPSLISPDIPAQEEVVFTERQAALRQAYEEWQATYLLRGLDGTTEFLRGETHKRGLRYQLTSTSLAQGLGMFIQTQMAQNDDDSRDRFERMLAHLLGHPALDYPALSSWLCMPDLPTSTRLEPDPHAEAWILGALLAARKQWGGLQRFDLDLIFHERAGALLDFLKDPQPDRENVFSPTLYRLIAREQPDQTWQAQTTADWHAILPLLRKRSDLPGRQEGLSLLQIGLEGLFYPGDGFSERAALALARLKRAQSTPSVLTGEVEEGFSQIASFCCLGPLALLEANREKQEQVWLTLTQAQPAKQDSTGANLRLLAMMSMAGTLWLE